MQQALVGRLADETGARLGGDHARHTVVALRYAVSAMSCGLVCVAPSSACSGAS
jgi:hypothetical protein